MENAILYLHWIITTTMFSIRFAVSENKPIGRDREKSLSVQHFNDPFTIKNNTTAFSDELTYSTCQEQAIQMLL